MENYFDRLGKRLGASRRFGVQKIKSDGFGEAGSTELCESIFCLGKLLGTQCGRLDMGLLIALSSDPLAGIRHRFKALSDRYTPGELFPNRTLHPSPSFRT